MRPTPPLPAQCEPLTMRRAAWCEASARCCWRPAACAGGNARQLSGPPGAERSCARPEALALLSRGCKQGVAGGSCLLRRGAGPAPAMQRHTALVSDVTLRANPPARVFSLSAFLPALPCVCAFCRAEAAFGAVERPCNAIAQQAAICVTSGWEALCRDLWRGWGKPARIKRRAMRMPPVCDVCDSLCKQTEARLPNHACRAAACSWPPLGCTAAVLRRGTGSTTPPVQRAELIRARESVLRSVLRSSSSCSKPLSRPLICRCLQVLFATCG